MPTPPQETPASDRDDAVAGRLDAPLDEYYRQIASARGSAQELFAGLDERQVHWRPDPARWSMAQCLRHVVTSNRAYLPLVEARVVEAPKRPHAGGGGRYSLLERWFVRTLEPPPKRRYTAPRIAVPTEGDTGSAAEILAAYQTTADEVLRLVVAASDVDHHRLKVRSPFFPLLAFRLGAVFAIVAAHDRRHLWQARQVRRHPDFPATAA